MIYDFDLYNHPESFTHVKNELKTLNAQIRIVEGLEHAKARLAATRSRSLESNTLSKCNVFMHYVNKSAAGSNFDLEIRKLNLNELAFCSISFEDRRLKSVIHHFKAANIRTYMTTTRISCLDRPEIFTRLKRLSAESEGKPFQEIYSSVYALHKESLQKGSMQLDEQMDDGTDCDCPYTEALLALTDYSLRDFTRSRT
ncbi:uncharacterized protein BO80DRAFT_151330 [Aspergillus ibericus CBS 121593]|uniref:Uncharacterized protein n=1 Tax=Aspergillus ibericus CBS 121593 TaxID=1448316 RepID=A0A395GUN8_9EURO|nr:hypothetical protein BO80DRAFT_151330 [Aspergillus ibericus CBS 121593]RAK98698.1 hypothetical protein BO80DRAFT_151330 [Aspergillus ibericus CBS 121593]